MSPGFQSALGSPVSSRPVDNSSACIFHRVQNRVPSGPSFSQYSSSSSSSCHLPLRCNCTYPKGSMVQTEVPKSRRYLTSKYTLLQQPKTRRPTSSSSTRHPKVFCSMHTDINRKVAIMWLTIPANNSLLPQSVVSPSSPWAASLVYIRVERSTDTCEQAKGAQERLTAAAQSAGRGAKIAETARPSSQRDTLITLKISAQRCIHLGRRWFCQR